MPVAPACNISCNYCNRKNDCVNESRPGVTSEILSPEQALARFQKVSEKLDNLSVVGIAGPGDGLANWKPTKKTLELIRQADPNITFCLSTNGLNLPLYAAEIIDLGIQHVTVTVNSIDPNIGASIYRDIHYQGEILNGSEGAEVLMNNQLQGIKDLAENEVLVKVNMVMIEGINDFHIPEIVKKVKEMGAFTSNIMPLIPVEDTVFGSYPQTSMAKIKEARKVCREVLPQMCHCKQCRADAIGLLGKDISELFIEGRNKCACACKKEAG
ncbi:MAG: radical SAM protein [Gracilibacter sp. BRH_c7a]|nr:MAG: radical SAM protein [Gracilibacter sp. BRH_c7a]